MYRKYASGKIDNSATNCDVEESPLRYTRSRRDRVREAKSQLPRCQRDKVSAATGTHVEGGRVLVQLNEYSDHLIVDTLGRALKDRIKSYVIHDSD